MAEFRVIHQYAQVDFCAVVLYIAHKGDRTAEIFRDFFLCDALFVSQLFHAFTNFFKVYFFHYIHNLSLLVKIYII